MAIIIDPDDLVLTTDVVVDTTAKTLQILTTGAVTSAGSSGGVAGQALYSWLKEQWKTSATFIKFPFPMEAIGPEQFEFINGWTPADDTTRNLIRTAGWSEKTEAGAVTRSYMGVVSLGSLGAADQPYYRWNSDAKVNFAFAGTINQAVQIFGDSSNGNFDYTDGGDSFVLFCREQGKTYDSSNNSVIGASTLTYQTYRFPLANDTDLKVSTDDNTISTTAPWTDITVEYFGTDQLRDIDGAGDAPFRIIITDAASNATTQEIYEKVQYLLRQDSDIDSGAGTVTGATASSLAWFVGDTLVGAFSMAIDGLNSNFLNSVEFYDFNNVKRLYPFVAAGTINFGSNAESGDFKYWMFYTTNPTGDFGSATAVIIKDKDGVDIAGTYSGSAVPFSFAYDTNVQGGRTSGETPDITVLGIGLVNGQYAVVESTITRAQGQTVLLAPALERNYQNPA